MDPSTGLPMAFGKQKQGPAETSVPTAGGSGERGGASGGRGARGVVGGGKRNRGRGGGRGGGDAGSSNQRQETESKALNGGVKRPHPSSASHPSLPPAPQSYPPSSSYGYPTSSRSNPNGMELGARGTGYAPAGHGDHGNQPYAPPLGRGGRGFGGGRGGSRGGRGGRDDGGSRGGGGGGRGGGHAPPERGFYKPSFAEDPWRDIIEARERAARMGIQGEDADRRGVGVAT